MSKNVWVIVTAAVMIAGELATSGTPALLRDDEAVSMGRRGKVRPATPAEAEELDARAKFEAEQAAEAEELAALEAAERDAETKPAKSGGKQKVATE